MESEFKKLADSIHRGHKRDVKAQMQALSNNMAGKCLALELIVYACKNKRIKMLQFLLNDSNLAKLRNYRLNDAQQNQKMIEAFYYAMCDTDMSMVIMLFNYWRECTHSLRVDNFKSIQRLDNILNEAKAKSEPTLFSNQNMKVEVQCFIKFIKYQLSIYSRLNKNNIIRNKVEAIHTVLDEYKNYKEIKNVRLPKETSAQDEEIAIRALNDDSTLNPKMYYHVLYEQYYNKLDFFTALLILDNLHIIKKKCVVQNIAIYHEIECTIFYYVWRVLENWKLYMPAKPYIYELECDIKNNQKFARTKINFDGDKAVNAPVIYLERQKFEKCLMNLLTNFETKNYNDNNKVPYDTSYLKHLPYMRDYYSLKKIVYYINALKSNTNIDVLCIQRALMVIGEMIKCSEESKHISDNTKALLEAGISVGTVKDMINIRNHIAKVDDGKLHIRIEVAKHNVNLFRGIQEELEHMSVHFNSVAEIYGTILNKTIIQHGLDLIEKRIKEWSPKAKKHVDYIYKSSKKLDTVSDENKRVEKTKELFAELEKVTGITRNFMEEIDEMLRIRQILQDKLKVLQDHSMQMVKGELPKYIAFINNTLKGIKGLDRNDKYFTIQCIQNVLSFFSDIGALENSISFAKLTLEELDSAEQSIYKEMNNISKRKNIVGNTTSMKYITYNKIKELRSLFISMPGSNVRDKRVKLISDLLDRVNKLRLVLGYKDNSSTEELWMKYKNELLFRLSFEMLLSDIFNIFKECHMNNLLFKPDKLLTSINLRIVLAHGDPILEVLGDALDPYDFPSALLEKALAVVKAGPSIEALDKLFRDGIDPKIIKNKQINKLRPNQQIWLNKFKECKEHDTYLKLIMK